MTISQDVLTIDPVSMNILNKIALGSSLQGEMFFEGGLLVQGNFAGIARIRGHLIIWEKAWVRGRLSVEGDVYLFGHLGDTDTTVVDTSVESYGTVYVARSGVSTAAIFARRMQVYEGASVEGTFKTLRKSKEDATNTP